MIYWPQMMKRKTASDYCDMSEAAFLREVLAGRLPSPVALGLREHWHRPAIDAALEQLVGGATANYDVEFWSNGKAAA